MAQLKLANVLFFLLSLDKCILFIYFIKLFCKLLHLYGLIINIRVNPQERRVLLECEYLLLPKTAALKKGVETNVCKSDVLY